MRRRALCTAGMTGGNENSIPNNQIHYTSIDNEIVYPYYQNGFGANIVSNTNENGLGIITFDGDITTFESYVYAEDEFLTSITIPNSVTLIQFNAFEYCTQLTSVTIGEGVTEIEYYAFYGCSSLSSVYCKAKTPPSLGSNGFDSNASGRKIYVPMESVDAYRVAEGWSDYADDIVGYDGEDSGDSNSKTIYYIRMFYGESGPDEYYVYFVADFPPTSRITLEMDSKTTYIDADIWTNATLVMVLGVPTLERLTYSHKEDDTYIYKVIMA